MTIHGTKLDLAFKALRAAGYLARANFMCCSSCAGSKVANDLSKKIDAAKAAGKTPKLPTGLVFYHGQDNDAVRSFLGQGRSWDRGGDTLYLRFGQIGVSGYGVSGYGDVGKPTIEVGADVCKALKNAGISYKWDGTESACIEVSIKSAFVAPAPVLTGRDLLIATMYGNPGGRTLTTEQYMAVYLACDGYGKVNEKFAKAQRFDRSHVRDSSPEAVAQAVSLIEAFTSEAVAA
jgi:hypothetical protein